MYFLKIELLVKFHRNRDLEILIQTDWKQPIWEDSFGFSLVAECLGELENNAGCWVSRVLQPGKSG